MARPHPALIEIAAGRKPPPTVDDPDWLLASALDHRMQGLLWSSVMRGEIDLPLRVERELAAVDLHTQGHHHRLWATLNDVTDRLAGIGLEVATFKGVAAEARFYERVGERPSRDVDLWLAPHQSDRLEEVVRLLQPDHRLLGKLDHLVGEGHLQSVDIRTGDVWIDLHTDPFKLGVETSGLDRIWGRTVLSGDVVRTLDPGTALLQFLLHLNKDRFSWLLGFADVARILDTEPVAAGSALDLAGQLGVMLPVGMSMGVVADTLSIDNPWFVQSGWRSRIWDRLWPDSVRLKGDEGYLRAHRRQLLLPFLAGSNPMSVLTLVFRMAIPNADLLDVYYSDVGGPYPFRLARGRARRWKQRRQAIAQASWVPGLTRQADGVQTAESESLSGSREPVLPALANRGTFIVIGGPDGAGKTSLARAIIEQVGNRGRYFHFVPSPVNRLRKVPPMGEDLVQKSRELGNRAFGIVRIGRALVRAWLSYILAIRPAVRTGRVVVGDRWLYGYRAQPLALKFFGPEWLAQLVLRLIPKPDALIILEADPEVMRDRKPELSIAEIETELDRWLAFDEGVIRLDATCGSHELAELVLQRLEAPRLRRYPPTLGHVLLPERPRSAALAGSTFYTPARRRGLLGQSVGRGMIRVFGTTWLRVARWENVPADLPQWEALLEFLFQCGLRPESLALYTRTQADRAGCSVMAIEDGLPIGFVRLGPPGLVDQEAMALEMLEAARPTSFLYPRLIGTTSVGEVEMILQTAVLKGAHRPPVDPPLESITSEIQSALEHLPKTPDIPAHWVPMHGDFTPWNLRQAQNQTSLIDWESVGYGPLGADEALYWATSKALGLPTRDVDIDAAAADFWIARLGAGGDVRDQRLHYSLLEVLLELRSDLRDNVHAQS